MRMALLVVLALAAFSLTPYRCGCRCMVRHYRWALRIRLFLVRPMLGVGARRRRILPTESTSRDGLRDVLRQLECANSPKRFQRTY